MFDCLGVDWGIKKSGIALGDSASFLFIPKDICLTKDIQRILDKYIINYNITSLVIGLPTNFYGQDTNITTKIRVFINILKDKYPKLKIQTINETGTSKESKNILNQYLTKNQEKNQTVLLDSLAAVKILERYYQNNQ